MRHRIAGAPITWGVCEVPGWGVQLPPDRVLRAMARLGLTATELGPDGFLPSDPDQLRGLLARHGLVLVGGFVPVVLHHPERLEDELRELDHRARTLASCGADTLVVAAATGEDGYESAPTLDDGAWTQVAEALQRVEQIGAAAGLDVVLHPHYGTIVESREQVLEILDRSAIGICVDTGHLVVGGADPLEIAALAGDRVRHVHLKDVDGGLASQVRAGTLGYRDAVAAGMYRALGQGDVDVDGLIRWLAGRGYTGWYVLEQDTVLSSGATSRDPASDAATSLQFVRRRLDAATAGAAS